MTIQEILDRDEERIMGMIAETDATDPDRQRAAGVVAMLQNDYDELCSDEAQQQMIDEITDWIE